MSKPVTITETIDAWELPHFDFPDPKMSAFLGDINAALMSLKRGTGPGPYGTIEAIMAAIRDFADDWNNT